MSEITTTPSTESVRERYQVCRYGGQSYEESGAEFDRWLAAHDQGVRDSVKPPDLTAKEHLDAAWDAACPVHEGRMIPAGTHCIHWWGNTKFSATITTRNVAANPNIRTLEPLPPVIPDDCMAVWASTRENESRRVWVRVTGFTPGLADAWDDGNLDADFAQASDLIDPVPVPEEER